MAKGNKGRRGNTVIIILLVIALGVFGVSAYELISYGLERKEASDIYSEVRSDAVRTSDSTASEELTGTDSDETAEAGRTAAESTGSAEPDSRTQVISMDFTKLEADAPGIVAWIYCADTNIDYPVMQTTDNDYYLTHLYNGSTNSDGSIFMDYRNGSIMTDKNVVLYGHHMRSGSMFADITKYKKADFYTDHPTMQLYTPDGDFEIELISGTVEDGNEVFIKFDFADDDEFLSYVAEKRANSTFESTVEVTAGDRLISLCTCSYEHDNARYMLLAKLTPVY